MLHSNSIGHRKVKNETSGISTQIYTARLDVKKAYNHLRINASSSTRCEIWMQEHNGAKIRDCIPQPSLYVQINQGDMALLTCPNA